MLRSVIYARYNSPRPQITDLIHYKFHWKRLTVINFGPFLINATALGGRNPVRPRIYSFIANFFLDYNELFIVTRVVLDSGRIL